MIHSRSEPLSAFLFDSWDLYRCIPIRSHDLLYFAQFSSPPIPSIDLSGSPDLLNPPTLTQFLDEKLLHPDFHPSEPSQK